MPAYLENSAVSTGLEKANFHSNPKERQCQRMLKLLNNCTYLTRLQSNTQNSPSQASTVPETENFQMFKMDLEKAEEPKIKLPTSIGSSKKQESSRKTSGILLTMPKSLTVWITNTLWKSLRDGNTRPPYLPPEKSVCRSRRTVRTRHETMDWFQIGKGGHQGCILSPCLYNSYAEYVM